jgi:hypothetical protein
MRSLTPRNSIFVCLVCLALAATSAAALSPQVSSWFVDPLTKVFPEDLPLKSAEAVAEFVAGRNSHVSVQWVLRSRQRVPNLAVTVEGLDGRTGEVPEAQTRTVGYVVVASNTDDTPPSEIVHTAPRLFPDVLLEKFPFASSPSGHRPSG